MSIFRRCKVLKSTIFVVSCALFSMESIAELSEEQAVQLGLANSEILSKWSAEKEYARGEMLHEGRWENPTVEFSEETLELPGGDSEEKSLWVRQKIPLAGAKRLERKAAKNRYAASEFEQEIQRRNWKAHLKTSFYQTLASQQSFDTIETICIRVKTINALVTQRAERGDASRFDAMRIRKELLVLESKKARAKIQYENQRKNLFSDIKAPEQRLEGHVLPESEKLSFSMQGFNWSDSPQLKSIDAKIKGEEYKAKAAAREHWPDLVLGIGRKELNEQSVSAEGNMISLGVSIPLFSHGTGEKLKAKGAKQNLKAEKLLQQRQLEIDLQSAISTFESHSKVALQLKNLAFSSDKSLSQLAEASYQAGELSVMELLDAYQSDLETADAYIEAALHARLALIKLQNLRGE